MDKRSGEYMHTYCWVQRLRSSYPSAIGLVNNDMMAQPHFYWQSYLPVPTQNLAYKQKVGPPNKDIVTGVPESEPA